jgi:3-carboxy-cis,cis-muconate cycloisomerase
MRANLDLTGGQIMAEAVMMELGRELGHERAHHAIQQASRRAARERIGLAEALAADPELAGRLSREDLERLLDPAAYLGLSAASADAVADRVERELP